MTSLAMLRPSSEARENASRSVPSREAAGLVDEIYEKQEKVSGLIKRFKNLGIESWHEPTVMAAHRRGRELRGGGRSNVSSVLGTKPFLDSWFDSQGDYALFEEELDDDPVILPFAQLSRSLK